MYLTRRKALEFHCNNHSYVKDEKEKIHVSPLVMDGPLADRIEGASTLYELLRNTVKRQPDDPFLGWHDSPQAPYQWWTYGQVEKKVEACGSGLMELPELVRKPVKCVGIYAISSPAWKIVQFGCWAYGMVVVTLFDTLGQESIAHICNEAELTVAICDTPKRAGKLIKSRSAYPELKYIVLISPMGDLDHLQTSAGSDMQIILFDDLLSLGSAKRKPVCPHGPDDLAMIFYTSGTTGAVKWPMITSRNLLAIVAGFQKLLGKYITKNDVIIPSLPLAHIFEQFAEILEGYGCTECCGPVSISCGGNMTGGHVGEPWPSVEIKLCNVPEMGLVSSRDNKGEICVRGASCISGYYKNPEASASLYDAEGWLHTGDIGTWLDGSLKVIDRREHMFKLAQGEYVAPWKLELVYESSPLISQIFVDGESHSNFPVALVVPEAEALYAALGKNVSHSTEDCTMEELCLDPRSVELVMKELQNLADEAGFEDFERVKRIKLLPEPFTVANSLLTPTLKVSRLKVRKVYAEVLADLYK
ncbi:hypothetical protein Aperf_G00000011827 [Anoplocephala perfoliata]